MVILENLENEFKTLIALRGDNRKQKVKTICFMLLDYAKERQMENISFNFIKSFLPSENIIRTNERIIKEIVSFLILEGYTEKDIIQKQNFLIERKELFSLDYGSYALLMAKNGYKRNYFYYQGITKKYILKGQSMTDALKPWSCESEIKSNKAHNGSKNSKDGQGCFVGNNKSFKKRFYNTTQKVLRIL